MEKLLDFYSARDSFELSSSVVPVTIPVAWQNDVVMRVVQSDAGAVVSLSPTSYLVARMNHFLFEKDKDISVLKEVVNWQRKQIDYNAVYNAYLLGAIDDDQFDADSEEFIVDFKRCDPVAVEEKLARLNRLLDIKLTGSDVSSLFAVPEDEALKIANNVKLLSE